MALHKASRELQLTPAQCDARLDSMVRSSVVVAETGLRVFKAGSERRHTYQTDNLLVLDLLALVHVLPSQGRVLLRMACGQGIDANQDASHEVCIMRKSIDGVLYRGGNCTVPAYCLLKPCQLLCGRKLAIQQKICHLQMLAI